MSLQLKYHGYSETSLNSISLNQDSTCFAVGVKDGFEVYTSEPLKRVFNNRTFPTGFTCVEMLWRYNILALVGSNPNAKAPYRQSSVVIYDCAQDKLIVELRFKEKVFTTRLTKKRILVSTLNKIYVFEIGDAFKLLKKENTYNPYGILCVSSIPHEGRKLRYVACFPDFKTNGRVIVFYEDMNGRFARFQVNAHKSPVYSCSLSVDGSYLATASRRGTLIRVFHTLQGKQLQELRRGTDEAKIYSMAFRKDNKYLAITSDQRTIHIFEVAQKVGQRTKNPTSVFGSTQRCFAYYRFPPMKENVASYPPSVAFFSKDKNHIYVSTSRRKMFKIRFDERKGGEAKLEWYKEFKDTQSM